MYIDRLNTCTKLYKRVVKQNEHYLKLDSNKSRIESNLNAIRRYLQDERELSSYILSAESEWRSAIVKTLEDTITVALSMVFPYDGYTAELDLRPYRSKLKIDASISSYNLNSNTKLSIKGSQGRLLQQILSFSAIITMMKVLGINTIYVDEAFSGASVKNLTRVSDLIAYIASTGVNMVIITQNEAMIPQSINPTIYFLTRSEDNKTTVEVLSC